MIDDVQDSDEDMEDVDEESEGSEGSLFIDGKSEGAEGSLHASTEAISELSGEERDSDEGTVEPPATDPCKSLLHLPRELRDKVCIISATFGVLAHTQMIRLRI